MFVYLCIYLCMFLFMLVCIVAFLFPVYVYICASLFVCLLIYIDLFIQILHEPEQLTLNSFISFLLNIGYLSHPKHNYEFVSYHWYFTYTSGNLRTDRIKNQTDMSLPHMITNQNNYKTFSFHLAREKALEDMGF